MLSCSGGSIFLFFFLVWFEIINERMGWMNTWIAVNFYSLRGCSNLFTLHALCIETLLQNSKFTVCHFVTHFNLSIQMHSVLLFLFLHSSDTMSFSVVNMKLLLNSCIWWCINCYGPHLFALLTIAQNQSTTKKQISIKKCGEQ